MGIYFDEWSKQCFEWDMHDAFQRVLSQRAILHAALILQFRHVDMCAAIFGISVSSCDLLIVQHSKHLIFVTHFIVCATSVIISIWRSPLVFLLQAPGPWDPKHIKFLSSADV